MTPIAAEKPEQARSLPKPTPADVTRMLRNGTRIYVSPRAVAEIAAEIRAVELEKGTTIYSAGEKPAGVWIIVSGAVEVAEGAGRAKRVVSLLREGDAVADVYVLHDRPASMNARCVQRTEVWFLPADSFRKLLATYPSLAIAWLCNLAGRLSTARERLLAAVGGNLRQRVARLLLEEAGNERVAVPQRTLAQMLGVQRTSLNRTLKELERDGVVRLGYGSIQISDPDRLTEIAAGFDDKAEQTPQDPRPVLTSREEAT